jgi:hypothetical protein
VSRLQRAYEALIDDLEEELEELRDEKGKESNAISLLFQFIVEKHGRDVSIKLAETIEKEGAEGLVDLVNDKCYFLGLDLVEEQK